MKLDAKAKNKAKELTAEEFARLCSGDWKPVRMDVGTRPAFLGSLPESKIVAVYGSASLDTSNPNADGNAHRTSIGGIDVYRVAEDSDDVAINKDWYAVHYEREQDGSERIYVLGPRKDAEHWIDNLPVRLAFAERTSVESTIPEAMDSYDN